MKHLILLILLAVSASACYKDLGNYDYKEINRVEFSGFPDELQYAYKNADTIRVHPKITGSLAQENLDNYFLKWQAVMKNGSVDNQNVFDLDSNRLDLEYFVQLPEAEYTVYLLVKDQTTGVTWRQGFDLSVTTATREGWLILSEADQCCRLDMVSTSTGEEIMVRDIWAGSPLSEWKGPRKLAHYVDMYAYGEPPVYLLSDDGTIQLNPDDFSYDYVNELRFEFGKWESDFVPTALHGNYVNMWRFCVGDNGIYAKDDMTPGAIYGVRLNKLEGESEYFQVAPAIGMSAYPYGYEPTVLMYDMTNSRFVQMSWNLSSMYIPTIRESAFPWHTGKEFVYMTGTLHDYSGEIFAILKDAAGKLWLHGITDYAQVADHYVQIDAPEIDKATAFAIHPILYYLFYAVDDKVYQYDITSGRSRILPIQLPDGNITESLNGEKISMLKFNIFINGDYSKPEGIKGMQYWLIVGSEKTDGGEELNGRVRMLEIPTNLDTPASVQRSYEGFGEVVDVVYRERT